MRWSDRRPESSIASRNSSCALWLMRMEALQQWLSFADDLGTSQLRVERALEQLEGLGYIRAIRDVVNGPVVDVTRAGRDYLIDKGWV